MTETIVTKHNDKDSKGNIVETRQAETAAPRVLQSNVSLQELVDSLGEDYVRKKVQAQLIIDFRSKIRTQLEKKDDNGDYSVSVEEIQNSDYSDWTPELKQRKSAEEKAKEQIDKLSPEQRAAVLAALENS